MRTLAAATTAALFSSGPKLRVPQPPHRDMSCCSSIPCGAWQSWILILSLPSVSWVTPSKVFPTLNLSCLICEMGLRALHLGILIKAKWGGSARHSGDMQTFVLFMCLLSTWCYSVPDTVLGTGYVGTRQGLCLSKPRPLQETNEYKDQV